ncbi:hypothetical protein HY497_00140 [Candidatus Woesearchaeota archaeon]|nr:hypothetical protein [Candidatus Woesearchaeota archaeon]
MALTLIKELKEIRKDLSFLKKHMVDVDSIMTEEDYHALLAYREEKKKGQLISHEDLKKKLGL